MSTETPAPLCFVDVETDGVHHGRRVWEVAMIRRDHIATEDGTVVHEQTEHQFFVGIDLRNSDPFGLQVGGFWDRHPAGRKMSGKTPLPGPGTTAKHDVAREVMRITFGTHLVGVNPAFDADTLAGMLRAEGYLPSWHYHVVDVSAMAIGWLNGRGTPMAPPWKSDALSAACGVETPSDTDRHTALGDTRWVARWYDVLTGTQS